MSKAALEHLRSTIPFRVMEYKYVPKPFEKTKRIIQLPVRITGGIGDLILGVGVAEKIAENIGVVLYSKWPEIAQLFTNIPCLHEKSIITLGGFECILNINALGIFQFSKDFPGFTNRKIAELYIQNRRFLSQGQWPEIAEHHPRLDHYLGTEAKKHDLFRDSITYASLGLEYRPFRVKPKIKPSPYNFKYITVHDGHDANNSFKGQATKNWSMSSWKGFVRFFKTVNPDIKIVQIGGPNSRLIPGIHIDRVRMASFDESLSILSGSLCHIDGDSGLTHAATVMGVKCVAMYGPSPIEFFGYPENENLSNKSTCAGECWWLTNDWMCHCPVGYEVCEAMADISVGSVLAAVKKVLDEKFKI